MRNSERVRRYDLIIAGVVFLLISVYFTYASFTSFLNQHHAAKSYHPVTAVVVQAQLYSQKNGVYTPHIQYQYFYQNHQFQATRFAYFNLGNGHFDQAQAVLNSYSVGKQIEIYIDPNQPSQSVISQQKPPMKYLGYFMIMPLLSFCLILWGFNFRRKA